MIPMEITAAGMEADTVIPTDQSQVCVCGSENDCKDNTESRLKLP